MQPQTPRRRDVDIELVSSGGRTVRLLNLVQLLFFICRSVVHVFAAWHIV